MFRFRVLILTVALLTSCIMTAIAAVDSATVVNSVNAIGSIAQTIAQGQGQNGIASTIGIIVLAIGNVFSFVWGHWHGKKVNQK